MMQYEGSLNEFNELIQDAGVRYTCWLLVLSQLSLGLLVLS